MMSAMHQQPQGAAFDLVLLLHAGCVVVGLATTVAAAATAGRLRRVLASAAPVPEVLRRYFRPGVNWVGRTVYGIPVFGVALVALSDGAYSLSDGWVVAGIVVFVALALVAEVTLWPAERRVQAALAAPGPGAGPADAGPIAAADAAAMARSAWVVLVLLVAGTVVMIAQP
jgi:hypothetical protein